MDLFEYQARDVFEKHGVPVLAGAVATTPEQAREAAERIGAASGGGTLGQAPGQGRGPGQGGGGKGPEDRHPGPGRARGGPGQGPQGVSP